jgi:hypothetical protein
MNRYPWIITACVVFATCCSASTCAIGTTSSPSSCVITGQAGEFTWTISDIQVALANVNVNPGVLTMSAVAAGVTGADQLQLVERLTPQAGSLPKGSPVIVDLDFDLSVTSTLASAVSQPEPSNTEIQTYLNAGLLGTLASQGIVPGVPGVNGTFLNRSRGRGCARRRASPARRRARTGGSRCPRPRAG